MPQAQISNPYIFGPDDENLLYFDLEIILSNTIHSSIIRRSTTLGCKDHGDSGIDSIPLLGYSTTPCLYNMWLLYSNSVQSEFG